MDGYRTVVVHSEKSQSSHRRTVSVSVSFCFANINNLRRYIKFNTNWHFFNYKRDFVIIYK